MKQNSTTRLMRLLIKTRNIVMNARVMMTGLLGCAVLSASQLHAKAESVPWFYSASVTIYKYNPPSTKVKMDSGTVLSPDEGLARILAKNAAEMKYRDQGDIVTALILVIKPVDPVHNEATAETVKTPNEPDRGIDQQIGGTGDGGAARRLVIPKGVTIRGVRVFAGRRVDGFQFLGSDGALYGFKGYGNPQSTLIKFEDGERLLGFRGIYGDQWDRVWVVTNKHEYGPFGGPGGSVGFSILLPPGSEFIGMHGRLGKVIDQAGLVTE